MEKYGRLRGGCPTRRLCRPTRRLCRAVAMCHAVAMGAAFLVLAACGGGEAPQEASRERSEAPAAEPRIEVVIGHVPSENPVAIIEKLSPLLRRLETELGVRMTPRLTESYSEFVEQMKEGVFDIAFLGPYAYVVGHKKAGYTAVLRPVRYGGTSYQGILIVRADGDIQSLKDLRGKTFGFVDEKSTSGYLFPAAYLIEHGIDPRKDLRMEFLGGHDNVVLNVLRGKVDAGACYKDARKATLAGREQDIEKLRILAETPEIPNEPIAVSPAFQKAHPELVERFVETMTALDESPGAGEIFEALGGGVTAYERTSDDDYAVVQRYAASLEALGGEGGG